jgi:leucyl/phenylalanyl-tRNA---protein transferase
MGLVPTPLPPSPWLFPDPLHCADGDGLIAVGADLHPSTVVEAYRRGIFPWPHDGGALPWFSPDPRAVLPLDRWRVSRSLRKTLRRCGWETTMNTAPEQVIDACATRPGDGTWITAAMKQAYLELHRLGWVHSVEVWDGTQLVGGLYGVHVGGVFTGESMFHRATGASKVALFDLVARMRDAGAGFVDVQLRTDHLASLGAVELPRPLFLALLAELRDDDITLSAQRLSAARLAELGPL